MSTVKAAFGRGVPLVNLDNATSIPCSFVLKLSDQFRPTDVTDGFRQRVVLDHVLDLQTLDAYDLVFAYDASRELMLIVSPAICNLLVDASNLETSLVSILRALFRASVLPLSLRQFLLILVEELGVSMRAPIGCDDHRLQAQVKPNRLRGDFQGLDVLFYQDGDKVAVSFIFGDGDAAWLTSIGQGTMPRDFKRSIHLGQGEMMPIPGKGVACIGGSLLVTFLFEGGIVSSPFKEVAKGFIKMSEGLLEYYRRNLIEPNCLFLFLECDQTPGCAFVVQTLTTLIVRVSTLAQCPVIDIAATPKGLCQDVLLFITRIEAILIGFLLLHALQYSTRTVKGQTVSLPYQGFSSENVHQGRRENQELAQRKSRGRKRTRYSEQEIKCQALTSC